ncbi:sulfur carrier protein ThiS [Thermoflexus sp.]|uniref:sulfur carrier protein ThiS n=1 Tax=Thermoflexus sp. TaxID=1969742 RepID=UPI002ADD890A|nr:sulfur carrier protein ThiS [Thermoflexus sp.]
MEATLIVNGQPRPYQPQTIRELLATLGLDPERPGIAVAVNAAVIPRPEWGDVRLQPGDRVEIVQAVAGG